MGSTHMLASVLTHEVRPTLNIELHEHLGAHLQWAVDEMHGVEPAPKDLAHGSGLLDGRAILQLADSARVGGLSTSFGEQNCSMCVKVERASS